MGTISLASGGWLINKSLTISGPGADKLSVRRDPGVGVGEFSVFRIEGNIAAISGLILNGKQLDEGNDGDSFGGGISNLGATLTITQCTISGNAARYGGGIHSSGTLTIINSTLSGNTATHGGGTHSSGLLSISNSTISGNAASEGGGIWGYAFTLTHNTIAGNWASRGGGIYNLEGIGPVRLRNSIIASNTAPTAPDVFGAMASQGFNLIGSNAGAIISPVEFSDQIGTAGSPIDPLLGPLQNNGGPTFTRALLSGSPASDEGHSSGSSSDQLGFTCPVGVSN